MGKLVSEREGKLQKLLIPLNIVVCVICIVAMLTLFLTPIVRVDIGKMFHSEELNKQVEDVIDDTIGKNLEGTSQEGIDYGSVVKGAVKTVFNGVEGTIDFTPVGAMKVAFAPEDEKGSMLVDELFLGDTGLITQLINSIVDGIAGIFESPEGQHLLEETVVSAITTALVENENLGDVVTGENVKNLLDSFKSIEDVTPGESLDEVTDNLCAAIENIMGESMDANTKKEISDTVNDLYDKALNELKKEHPGEEIEKVTLENIICVAISSNVDLGELDISGALDGILDQNKNNDNKSAIPEAITAAAANGSGQKDQTIVTTYDGLISEIGFGPEEREELKTKIKTELNGSVDKIVADSGINEIAGYYGYLFYVMLIFIGLWFILFLFSLIHIFTKNKRFMMWYVKLLCWIPSMIWLGLTIAPGILLSSGALGSEGGLVTAIFASISSFTWINGLCYVLLWLISIFWAFPIKHKIRKERKENKV